MELYNRIVMKDVIENLKNKRLVFIIGPRRVGKTTLMQMILEKFKVDKRIYIDVETLSEYSMFDNYQNFISYMELNGFNKNDEVLIGIDEVQHISEINLILKSVVDHNKSWYLLCSGSSSLGILKNVKESLAGRKRVVNLKPLFFEEFLKFKEKKTLIEKVKNVENQKDWNWIKDDVLSVWYEYVLYGGMPEVVLQEDREEKIKELKDIVQSYIKMDVYSYLRGEVEILRYNKLIQLIANNSGKLMNISSLSRKSGIKRNKIEDSIFLLDAAEIIKLLPPFFANKNKEITSTEKIIFYDTGIRNSIINDFQNLDNRHDKGFILEIAISNNIRGWDILFYRTKHQTEIDFILRKHGKLMPIEVKSGNPKVPPRALRFFMDRYDIDTSILITKDDWKTEKFNKHKVHFIPAPIFALRQLD
jgi:predicted AAA+ superfamily ATPase